MKAIFFDNDGVLVDSERLYYEACRESLRGFEIELSEAEFREISLCQGGTVYELVAARGIAADMIETARTARNQRYAESLAGIALIPGVRQTLESLHGRAALAVVTSSRLEHFKLQHAENGLLPFFD